MAKTSTQCREATAAPASAEVLPGLPRSLPFELPSSWATRAALSQGVGLEELLIHIGFSRSDIWRVDLDVLLMSKAGIALLEVAQGCSVFPLARVVFKNLQRFDRHGKALLRDRMGRPFCRYCPQCMRERRVAHFQVHERFAPWCHCPLHDCLLEDCCPWCQRSVHVPFKMVDAGPKGEGVAFLSLCQHCGKALQDVDPVSLAQAPTSDFDLLRLKNGRAFLAALACGRIRVEGEGVTKALPRTAKYFRAATFWRPGAWVSPSQLRAALATERGGGPLSDSESAPMAVISDSDADVRMSRFSTSLP